MCLTCDGGLNTNCLSCGTDPITQNILYLSSTKECVTKA
jgi:hypothetical protein